NTYLESPKDKGIVSDTPPIAISFLQFPSTPNADTIKYGDSKNQLEMLGIDKLHQKGYRGEGMLIAVLDDGFKNADRVPYLKSIFEEKRILATYNFVKKKSQVYEDGGHGTSVLSCIATDVNGKLYGSAYKSTFVLLKTEKLEDESVQEEANILFALEYADSLGVDVVNISLGYDIMDNPLTSYSQAKRNGFTSLSARAVNWASTKGMIAVVAAGNSGQTSDKLIMTPADADSALTVGGVDAVKNIYTKSSIGPRIDGITKPDLMAKGVATVLGGLLGNIATGSGTSYASPLMAGLVAIFWQQNPTFTAAQIKNALKKSGDKYLNPSSQFGFGIPSPDSALKFLVPLPPEILGLENRNNLKLNISPNPFDNFTLPKLDFVSNKKNCLAIIYNSKGEIVWRNIVQNNNDILKLENLSAGQYVLKITDGSSFGIKKITKIN
nr:S8 family peptidase [Pseudarcicella sp.]